MIYLITNQLYKKISLKPYSGPITFVSRCFVNERCRQYVLGSQLIGMIHYAKLGLILMLVWLTAGCEPYNLDRAAFQTCARPSAAISFTSNKLETFLFLTDKEGDIGVIGWDLGDGRSKTGDPIKVAYTKPGTYTVTVVMANPCDDSFTTSRSITVTN